MQALAEAGFRAVAPDMRGYGQTDAPAEIDQYTLLHLTGDIVGLCAALGAETAVVAGHDWGAPVAWHCALLRPDLFRAVIGLSVPFIPRRPNPADIDHAAGRGLAVLSALFPDARASPRRNCPAIRARPRAACSIPAPAMFRAGAAEAPSGLSGMVPRDGGFLTRTTRSGGAAALAERGGSGFLHRRIHPHRLSRRAELVPQYRPQLGAARALRRGQGHACRRSTSPATAIWSRSSAAWTG